MQKFLISAKSPGCHPGTPCNLSGNPLSGPSTLKMVCSVCGNAGDIDSFQSLDRLPIVFGDFKSFYEMEVQGQQAIMTIRPNLPIYREALNVTYRDELNGKTGKDLLPRLTDAIADLEARANHYRAINAMDWFGYDAVLGFLKMAESTCKQNPNLTIQFKLDIG